MRDRQAVCLGWFHICLFVCSLTGHLLTLQPTRDAEDTDASALRSFPLGDAGKLSSQGSARLKGRQRGTDGQERGTDGQERRCKHSPLQNCRQGARLVTPCPALSKPYFIWTRESLQDVGSSCPPSAGETRGLAVSPRSRCYQVAETELKARLLP